MKSLKKQKGQGLVEYILLIGLLIGIIAGITLTFGDNIENAFNAVGSKLESAAA